ncbi:hypothetical protein SAMN06297144_0751 [Sphingomonas guangdongensis]|uniref:Uncharacterized protein n=1 Tax=Sphingomonas guangdongensis TaxID=1141890 RepID=A0A285QEB9_9SPHN|nr:hypothetical protein [Sphingomonas guangdongensis]SOB79824.1 hypothetical protein SAMN06297144_0751 [Sphingomonas guangdongensis]
MIALLLLGLAPQDLVTQAKALTRAEVPCRTSEAADDITVCARRDADKRYRITFVLPDTRDNVPRERDALLQPKLAGCGRVGPFFADCGFAGVTMTTGAGGTQVKTRKLAP